MTLQSELELLELHSCLGTAVIKDAMPSLLPKLISNVANTSYDSLAFIRSEDDRQLYVSQYKDPEYELIEMGWF